MWAVLVQRLGIILKVFWAPLSQNGMQELEEES